MHAADAARGEYFDSCAVGDPACRRNGGGPIPFLRNRNWQVANTHLLNVAAFCKKANLFSFESNVKLSFQDCDGCWHSARVANNLFQTYSGFQVLRSWQPVSGNSRLESND